MFSIGHSTREAAELIDALKSFGVTLLADVRTIPRSRRVPQFNREKLAETLKQAGIDYRHMPELGGFRKPRPDSLNTAWRNESFRGYADYMQAPEFRAALDELIALGQSQQVAFMCAEALPFRCHRSLISDALVARGLHVRHIMSAGRATEHVVTPFARIEGEQVTYPTLA